MAPLGGEGVPALWRTQHRGFQQPDLSPCTPASWSKHGAQAARSAPETAQPHGPELAETATGASGAEGKGQPQDPLAGPGPYALPGMTPAVALGGGTLPALVPLLQPWSLPVPPTLILKLGCCFPHSGAHLMPQDLPSLGSVWEENQGSVSEHFILKNVQPREMLSE